MRRMKSEGEIVLADGDFDENLAKFLTHLDWSLWFYPVSFVHPKNQAHDLNCQKTRWPGSRRPPNLPASPSKYPFSFPRTQLEPVPVSHWKCPICSAQWQQQDLLMSSPKTHKKKQVLMPRGKKETGERATFRFAEPGKANWKKKKNGPCTRQVENVTMGREENVQETNLQIILAVVLLKLKHDDKKR